MAYFVTWITTFLLCAECMFPYELKSTRNNVSAVQVSKSSIAINTNFLNKDSSTEKDNFKSSRKLKRSLRDTSNHWFNSGKLNDWKPIGNVVDRYINNYIGSVNLQRSKRGDQENNNFSPGEYNIHKRRNEDSSEISKCSVFPARDIGERCRSLMECPESAVCKDFKCVCLPNQVDKDNECQFVKVGSYCQYSQQCPRGYECNNGICNSISGYDRRAEDCLEGRRDRCYNDADCEKLIVNGSCNISVHGNFCNCPNSYIHNFLECLPRVNLGGVCKDSLQCPRNSVCDYGTCACDDGYVNKDGECVKKGINQCYNDGDCSRNHLKNSYCVEDVAGNLCQCPAGYVASKKECLPYVKLGGACKLSLQCLSNSVCIDDSCTCSSDYIEEGLACVKPNLGKCSEFTGCPIHSECRNGFCVCIEGYNKRLFGCGWETHHECYNGNDCQEKYLEKRIMTCSISFLYENTCECPSDYALGKNGCVLKQKLGGLCNETVQCPIPSSCINGTCACNEKYYILRNGYCTGRIVGDPCYIGSYCTEESDCINDTCTCQDHYINVGDRCKYSFIGDFCTETRECPKLQGMCQNGQCVCKKGYEYDRENRICVSQFVGGLCDSQEECASWGKCSFGACLCASGFVEEGQVCVREYTGTPGWIWGLIVGAVAVVIICVGLLIVRWKRNQKRRPLPTVSAAVDAKFPRHSNSRYQENALKPLLNQLLHPQQQRN